MNPEAGGSNLHRNVDNYLPFDKVSYPRRLRSSSIQLW
jgi:hypothetical protein